MEVTGNLAMKAEKEKLWNTLVDLEQWRGSMPEIIAFEKTADHEYQMTVKLDLGIIKGDQTLKIKLSDLESPTSCTFNVENELIKTAKGNFLLKDPAQAIQEDPANTPAEVPEGTKTFLIYKLDLDAGNPFYNTIMEGFKGKLKEGFEELLKSLDARALAA